MKLTMRYMITKPLGPLGCKADSPPFSEQRKIGVKMQPKTRYPIRWQGRLSRGTESARPAAHPAIRRLSRQHRLCNTLALNREATEEWFNDRIRRPTYHESHVPISTALAKLMCRLRVTETKKIQDNTASCLLDGFAGTSARGHHGQRDGHNAWPLPQRGTIGRRMRCRASSHT